jgi:membrane protease YdiL (CAAX protease family)
MNEPISNWRFFPRGHALGERAPGLIIPIYILTIAIAEAIGVFVLPLAGMLCQALLVPALLAHYLAAEGAPHRRILPALTLVPLLRVLSLIMPVKFIPPIYWYALIGIPLLVAIVQTARLLELTPAQLGLHLRSWPLQLGIALGGAPLSLLAFLILQQGPAPAVSFNGAGVAVGVAILIVFTGFVEELLFRGLLQHVAGEVFGPMGFLLSGLLFAIVYLGSLSGGYIVFVAVAGLVFGWCVRRTGSIWGVVGAHSMISVGVAYVWPYTGIALGGQAAQRASELIDLALWLLLAFGIGLLALAMLRRLWPAIRSLAARARR